MTAERKPMSKAAKWTFAVEVAKEIRESMDEGRMLDAGHYLKRIEELFEWPEPEGFKNPEEEAIHDRMNTINILCDQAHSAADRAGWWLKNRGVGGAFGSKGKFGHEIIPEKLMMTVSELGEAVREYSKHGPAAPDHLDFQYELADVAIRLFDIAGRFRIPLGDRIIQKMIKNKHRGFRHGGKHA